MLGFPFEMGSCMESLELAWKEGCKKAKGVFFVDLRKRLWGRIHAKKILNEQRRGKRERKMIPPMRRRDQTKFKKN